MRIIRRGRQQKGTNGNGNCPTGVGFRKTKKYNSCIKWKLHSKNEDLKVNVTGPRIWARILYPCSTVTLLEKIERSF